MTVLYFLVPLALGLAFAAAYAFRWAAHDEQFDDLESAAVRMLDDAPEVPGSGLSEEPPS